MGEGGREKDREREMQGKGGGKGRKIVKKAENKRQKD